MKKKLLSLLLVLAMVLSFTACGKKDATVVEATAKTVLADITTAEANTVNMEFNLEAEDGTMMALRCVGANQDDLNGYLTIEAKFNIDPYTVEEYIKLTEVYVVNGDTYYVNLKQILDFASTLDSQFAIIGAYLQLPGDYLMLTADDLAELYAESGVEVSVEDFKVSAADDENDKYTDVVVEVLGNFLNEYFVNAGDSIAKLDNGKISITVNNENVVAAMEALAKIDLEAYATELAEGIDEIDGTLSNTAYVVEELEGLNASLATSVEDLKATGVGEEDVNVVFLMGMNGTAFEASCEATVKDEEGGAVVGFTLTTSPDKATDFSIPASTVTYSELMSILTDLGIY